MLKTRTDLWRAALLSSLGLFPYACADASHEDNSNPGSTSSAQDEAEETLSNEPSAPEPDSNEPSAPEPATGEPSAPEPATGEPSAPEPATGEPSAPEPDSGEPEPQSSGGAASTPEPEPEPSKPQADACEGGTPYGEGTGLVECKNGAVHRPAPVTCPDNLADRAGLVYESVAGSELDECRSDVDCTERALGFCEPQGQAGLLTCEYGCETDTDCGDGFVCVCGADIGRCEAATCQGQSDCGEGYLCAGWFDRFGTGCGEPREFACQTAMDECASDLDCSEAGGYCSVDDEGVRTCEPTPGIACGRPFVVDGSARLAQAISSRDFLPSTPLRPVKDGLGPQLLQQLGQEWTAIGLMEHASIAAFARFSLQLLHLGAPLPLQTDCQRALADETGHAKLAFGLASAYLDAPVGPGALPMDGAFETPVLEEVLKLVIEEGCAGETVAALEAAEALASCRDPQVRAVLTQIRDDENRHAQLAWRFVAWALKQDSKLVPIAKASFDAIERSIPGAAPLSQAEELNTAPFGVLTDRARHEVRRAALAEVVLPCARKLLTQSEMLASQGMSSRVSHLST